MIIWDEDGVALVQDRRGDWVPLYLESHVADENSTLLDADAGLMTGVSVREDELRKRAIRRGRYKED
jgi:hypothetical protein